jgi:acyl-CoA thioester hydrolase
MGYAYYGNYAIYFEVARVEMLRKLGLSYKELEEKGTWLPVLEFKTKYLAPAKYDDLLTVKVFIQKKPGVRIVFEYEVYNESGKLLNQAETTLVFVSAENGKPTPPPKDFISTIAPYFEKIES